MAPDVRGERLQVRMSDREREMLTVLAEHEQLTASDYIRHLVRREYALLQQSKPKGRKRG